MEQRLNEQLQAVECWIEVMLSFSREEENVGEWMEHL
jgi:hypothetical protein